VLKPGGLLWFNFDDFMSTEGLRWFQRSAQSRAPGDCFTSYHPDLLRRLVETCGFAQVVTHASGEILPAAHFSVAI
jgi:hypothetical protein